jgi:hypothetical protein
MTPRSAALLQRSPAPGRVSVPSAVADGIAASPGRRPKSAASQLLEELTQLTALEQELENALTAEVRAPVRSSPRLQARVRALPLPATAAKENAAPSALADEYAALHRPLVHTTRSADHPGAPDRTPLKGLADFTMRSLSLVAERTPIGRGRLAAQPAAATHVPAPMKRRSQSRIAVDSP